MPELSPVGPGRKDPLTDAEYALYRAAAAFTTTIALWAADYRTQPSGRLKRGPDPYAVLEAAALAYARASGWTRPR
jgi:hypothetical protein